MSAATRGRLSWTVAAPVAGLVVLAAAWGRHPATAVAAVIAVFLVGRRAGRASTTPRWSRTGSASRSAR